MNIINTIVDSCYNATCFKCNSKMIKAKKENILELDLHPITCLNCKVDFHASSDEFGIRFIYKCLIVGIDNFSLGEDMLSCWHDDGLNGDAICSLYGDREGFDKFKTLEDLYKYLNEVIKIEIFK